MQGRALCEWAAPGHHARAAQLCKSSRQPAVEWVSACMWMPQVLDCSNALLSAAIRLKLIILMTNRGGDGPRLLAALQAARHLRPSRRHRQLVRLLAPWQLQGRLRLHPQQPPADSQRLSQTPCAWVLSAAGRLQATDIWQNCVFMVCSGMRVYMQRHIHEETSGVRERTKRRGYEAMHCSLVIAHCPGTVLCMQKL